MVPLTGDSAALELLLGVFRRVELAQLTSLVVMFSVDVAAFFPMLTGELDFISY